LSGAAGPDGWSNTPAQAPAEAPAAAAMTNAALPGTTIADMAAAVDSVLQALDTTGTSGTMLVGYSMGSRVALAVEAAHAAATRPDSTPSDSARCVRTPSVRARSAKAAPPDGSAVDGAAATPPGGSDVDDSAATPPGGSAAGSAAATPPRSLAVDGAAMTPPGGSAVDGAQPADVQRPLRLVLVSGSAGIEDGSGGKGGRGGCDGARAERAAADDRTAGLLRALGVDAFLRHWYGQALWDSLRRHPRFGGLLQRRAAGADEEASEQLAAVLRWSSPGRSEPQWASLRSGRMPPVTLLVGSEDAKYVAMGRSMLAALQAGRGSPSGRSHGKASEGHAAWSPAQAAEATAETAPGMPAAADGVDALHVLPKCGHAVHIEAPLALLQHLMGLADSAPLAPSPHSFMTPRKV